MLNNEKLVERSVDSRILECLQSAILTKSLYKQVDKKLYFGRAIIDIDCLVHNMKIVIKESKNANN